MSPAWTARVRVAIGVLAITALSATWAGCSDPPKAIELKDGSVTVRNLTKVPWRRAHVVVNGYYSAMARDITPGGSARSPLEQFVASLGQKFNPNTPVTLIEVRITDETGAATKLTWTAGQK